MGLVLLAHRVTQDLQCLAILVGPLQERGDPPLDPFDEFGLAAPEGHAAAGAAFVLLVAAALHVDDARGADARPRKCDELVAFVLSEQITEDDHARMFQLQ